MPKITFWKLIFFCSPRHPCKSWVGTQKQTSWKILTLWIWPFVGHIFIHPYLWASTALTKRKTLEVQDQNKSPEFWMIKIPNQKTIVFGEVHHFFDGRLGLLGKISMNKLQLPHLLFAPQIRGSLSAIGENQGVKKRRGQWHGTMNSWLLNDIFHTTGAGMFTYNYHQNQLNVQTTPKTEEMWTISLKWFPIKVPFNKLNHTNFLVNHISNTILLCQPRTPPTLVLDDWTPKKIEGQTLKT